MPKPFARRLAALSRLTITLVLITLAATSCNVVHKHIEVEKVLGPLSDATPAQLITEVNRMVAVRSIHGKVDIQFEDLSTVSSGIAEKYSTADGAITLQRPGKVYLVIQVPVIGSDVAQMTSDGDHFRIAILKGDEKYHRFVRGTNNAVYPEFDGDGAAAAQKGKANTEAQTVKALSNLRPQHLTEALLVSPIDSHASGLMYARSEFFQSEKDTGQSQSKKRIVRGYYLLDEFQPGENGSARLLRRFWFDRVAGIRLARLQTFSEAGALTTDVTYGDLKKFSAEGNVVLPSQISLTRPQDHYKISITYQAPESATLDREYPADVFLLENRWGLREVDLDAQKNSSSPTPSPKP
jgi:hypothetical protein